MKDLLNYIVQQIAGEGNYEISEEESDGIITFTVKVNKEKIGMVIGKGGKVIKAIQELVKTKAKTEDKKVYIRIAEES
jgi:predicted RNA-binding protein YlqC (UPF0109 family)